MKKVIELKLTEEQKQQIESPTMTLEQFLSAVNAKESMLREICSDDAISAVKNDGYALPFVDNQTPEICLAAVKQNGYALLFVHNQTPEICLAAVKQNGYALQYVRNQTPEICIAAVKQKESAIQYVKRSTFDPAKIVLIDGVQYSLEQIK